MVKPEKLKGSYFPSAKANQLSAFFLHSHFCFCSAYLLGLCVLTATQGLLKMRKEWGGGGCERPPELHWLLAIVCYIFLLAGWIIYSLFHWLMRMCVCVCVCVCVHAYVLSEHQKSKAFTWEEDLKEQRDQDAKTSTPTSKLWSVTNIGVGSQCCLVILLEY